MDYLKVPLSKHDWILNTPERKEILNEGAPKHANPNLLGKGAFGSVFQAIFKDRPVALKIVKNRGGINRTENEANILGWKHQNIVQILIVESTTKYGLIIMEHFPKCQNLQQILDVIELPLEHRVFISLDILNALGYCHKQNLLHLDVKPQNILVAYKKAACKQKLGTRNKRNYACKLCDFGSSLRLGDQETRKILAGGTIRYMPPEALRAEELTPAADIFSLGILMWQLQQRRTPYDSIQCNEVVAFQVVKHDMRPNSDFSQFLMPLSLATSRMPHIQSCSCLYFSTETRQNSKKYSKLADLAVTPLKRGCYSAKKDVSVTVSISPNSKTGRSIQILHATALKKVARDLNKDLDFDNVEQNSSNGEKQFSLSLLFPDTFNRNNENLKIQSKVYHNIYESCWQAKPEIRPKVKEIKLKLNLILRNET